MKSFIRVIAGWTTNKERCRWRQIGRLQILAGVMNLFFVSVLKNTVLTVYIIH